MNIRVDIVRVNYRVQLLPMPILEVAAFDLKTLDLSIDSDMVSNCCQALRTILTSLEVQLLEEEAIRIRGGALAD